MPATLIKTLGLSEYQPTWAAMKTFTSNRDAASADELWLTEHPPVFTQGLNGKPEHLLAPGDIPVVQIDRGGQVTYHGPGQLVVYCLLDINRRGIGVRRLVRGIEQSIIELLGRRGIEAAVLPGAPGVYVGGAKIAALGLRIRKGCCYHGLALNVDMDLEPFSRINPCGYQDLAVTQLRDLGVSDNVESIGPELAKILEENLVEEIPSRTGR